jgi:hypothetical protein
MSRRVNTNPRQPGRLKGRIHIAPDFDEPLPEEILAAFRGDETRFRTRATLGSREEGLQLLDELDRQS